MLTHEELKKQLLSDDEVKQEYARLNGEEFALLDQFLAARRAAGMTQAAVAEKNGHQNRRNCSFGKCFAQRQTFSDCFDFAKICTSSG